MLFADDVYLYCKVNEEEAFQVLEILKTFEAATGHKINFLKSSLFFSSNVIQYNKEHICQLLQMVEARDRITYMGLPNLLGRNKSSMLNILKDKMSTRIQSGMVNLFTVNKRDFYQIGCTNYPRLSYARVPVAFGFNERHRKEIN